MPPISERFRILDEEQGIGGFGEVYKCLDNELERHVAIKRLMLINDEEAKQRFKREAKVLAKLTHPNIPAIYDVDMNNDDMIIYFEFIDGLTLEQIIDNNEIPAIEDIQNWFIQIASALEHAHENDIIHRDVKPANIIISKDRRVATLVDFGIAYTQQDIEKITRHGYTIGTEGYMSPEQRAGEQLDGRSDIYSLGITIYETLSGNRPQYMGYSSLSEENESIPPAVDILIKKCIQSERSQRIESAQEFIREISRITRTDMPLSELLTEGRLHEIMFALQQLSFDTFNDKPDGQRLLVYTRLYDLINANKTELLYPTVQLITLLARLAINDTKEHYPEIINYAFEWGFEKIYSNEYIGNSNIRESIIDACKIQIDRTHDVLSTQFNEFINDKKFTQKDGWYNHDIRKIAQALLANPKCSSSNADRIATFLIKFNKETH